MPELSAKNKITLILLGVFICIILLEIGLRISGFIILFRQEQKNRSVLKEFKDSRMYRIMCLGGSTTADGGKYSYPSQLEDILNKGDMEIEFRVINKGICGADSALILSKLRENLRRYKPDMVITMIGANDNYDTVSYDASLKSRIKLIFKNFRVYKLAKLIFIPFENKFQQTKKFTFAPLNSKHLDGFTNAKNLISENIPKKNSDFFEDSACCSSDVIDKFMIYSAQQNFDKAEKLLIDAIRTCPDCRGNYFMLGDFYFFYIKEYKLGESLIKEALSIFPDDTRLMYELGVFYSNQNKYSQAEELFKEIIQINPLYKDPYGELITIYRKQKDLNKLQKLCEFIIDLNIERDYLYGLVATIYDELGKYEMAEEYYKKANDVRLKYYKPVTRYNYQKIRDIVINQGLTLVCIQYPIRNIKPLKKLLKDTAKINFVDSKEVFKEAVRNKGYDYYFYDNFAGEFGHCTPKGNRLLAGNVANVILKEYFDKWMQ